MQGVPGVTGKFSLRVQNEAGQRLTEFCQENALVIANTLSQKHKIRLYTRTSPDGQYQNQIDSVVCSKNGEALYSQQKKKKKRERERERERLGVNCGSDHELLSAKFRLNLKKGGKTTRPFRYDLNQIPYEYTVEVTKGLGLIERVPEELWMEVHDIV